MKESPKNDNKKRRDFDAIEDQVADIMKSVDADDFEDTKISKDVRDRVESADLSEIDEVEEDLGIDATDALVDLNWEEEPRKKVQPLRKKQPEEENQVKDESVNGQFKITVSEDRMSAWMDIYPPEGKGIPVEYGALRKRLDDMGIVYGVNHELIKKVIETVEVSKTEKRGVTIAQGSLPTEGKDGSVMFSFGESPDVLNKEKGKDDEGVD